MDRVARRRISLSSVQASQVLFQIDYTSVFGNGDGCGRLIECKGARRMLGRRNEL
jgi:hypothetical protein